MPFTFKEWITSSAENPKINGQWGPLHICVLIACIAIIIALSLIFRNKSDKAKRIVAIVLASIILFFELARRSINVYKAVSGGNTTVRGWLSLFLPRPWCAISCWTIILSMVVNKKFVYNIASIMSLLCALIFFAYPGVGFNNKYMLFENIYSITTHALLLISSIVFMTLGLAKFEYKNIWKEIIYFAGVLVYTFLEIYVLKIEGDPMYFMPGNTIQEILSIDYGWFLVGYILFIIFYFNLFYLIGDRKNVFKKKNKRLNNT